MGQDRLRYPQDDPKMGQDRPRYPQDAPKMPQVNQFGFTLSPSRHEKPFKTIVFQCILKTFLNELTCFSDPPRCPRMPPRCCLRCSQGVPRCSQDLARCFQDAPRFPKTSQDTSKTISKHIRAHTKEKRRFPFLVESGS